ncbi:MAG: BolA/IbaG family iron-sulfur metabolism protein [Wigglesworthia glossinidia]|nr:BolA/IbaG family iron-sulfur metabolism protein [Wigglesworthia glossinidia]
MEIKEIKNILKNKLQFNDIHITNNGKYFKITLISDIFSQLNHVQREQMIYKYLKPYIKNNSIHAISIYPYTLKEWELKNKINFKNR